jgi:hypothetical protein
MLRIKPNTDNSVKEFEWIGVLEMACRISGDGFANCEYLIMKTE